MMNFSPFFRFPPFRRPYPYYYSLHNREANPIHFIKNSYSPNVIATRKEINKQNHFPFSLPNEEKSFSSGQAETLEPNEECFEIFGLKLHFDDLLIIALLFFLYHEEVKDPYLYIALILLLLS